MPKIAITDEEKQNRVVRSIIAKNMELYGITEEELAIKCRFTTQTLRNKKKRPETFTLKELRTLCRTLHVSNEDKMLILS